MAVTEAQRHPGSYVDPGGAVYEVDGEILRGIRPPFADLYRSLLQNHIVAQMLGSEIVETRLHREKLNGYPLTLWHRKLAPVTYCFEWPGQMLRDAALLNLDICLKLVDEGLVLQDAYPWNVLFEGPRAVFVDFTSIVPQDPNLLWVAYDQFCRFFLYPLALYCFRPARMVRLLLQDHISGISADDLVSLLPGHAWLRVPWLVSRVYLPRMLLGFLKRTGQERSLTGMSARLAPTAAARRAFFRSLRRDVAAIPLRIRKSFWSGYYADMESFLRPESFNVKQSTVARILERCRPQTVTDIGCNRGGYAILAACAGARVTAFDTDDDSVALLYEYASSRQLNILALNGDILNPAPACGWRAQQYAAGPERLHSEMAFALALIHHLAITQRQTFERIVPALADYADRWLLTEFVPLDDPRSQELMLTHRRDMSWYTLENCLAALRATFASVETFPSYPEGRTLILCSR